MEREQLSRRALEWEAKLVEGLDSLSDHPLVGGHRSGVGFLGALVLDPERLAADPDLPTKAYQAVRARGVISRAIGGDALQISPPLTMNDAEFDEMLAGFRRGLDDLA